MYIAASLLELVTGGKVRINVEGRLKPFLLDLVLGQRSNVEWLL